MPAVTVEDVLVLPRLPHLTAEASVERPVRRVATALPVLEGAGILVYRPLPGPVSMAEGDPIIFLDHAGPTINLPGEGNGAPWHPHRGIETVSYVMDGEVSHHDSNGGGGVIAEGDTQWMTAGGGILHDELPTERFYRNGGPVHAVQLWVNLPAALKFTPPRYQAITSSDLCLLTSPDGGALIRLIAGDLGEYHGPGATHTPITYLHATILPGAQVTFPWNPAFNAMAYVLTGRGQAGTEGQPVDERQLVLFGPGDHVTLRAEKTQDRFAAAMDVLVFGGLPIGEPIEPYGGFVMNSRREIDQAIDDLKAGRLGTVPADQLAPRRFS
jgi:redox-sensitive bicupin YhaK (pirin superfamily)